MTTKSSDQQQIPGVALAPLHSEGQPWSFPGVNTELHGRILLNVLARTAARLEGLRQTINAQNGELLERAARVHDAHQYSLAQLRKELQDPLNDEAEQPTLEDAYGQHLLDRASADDLLSQLHHGLATFRSRTAPENRRDPQLTVPPAIAETVADEENERDDTSGSE